VNYHFRQKDIKVVEERIKRLYLELEERKAKRG